MMLSRLKYIKVSILMWKPLIFIIMKTKWNHRFNVDWVFTTNWKTVYCKFNAALDNQRENIKMSVAIKIKIMGYTKWTELVSKISSCLFD